MGHGASRCCLGILLWALLSLSLPVRGDSGAAAAISTQIDAAEQLALWGYDGAAWQQLQARAPQAVQKKSNSLTRHQRAQVQFVRMRGAIAALVAARDEIDFDELLDDDSGNRLTPARRRDREGNRRALAAAAAKARQAGQQLLRSAVPLPPAQRVAWTVRAWTGQASIATLLGELASARGAVRRALAVPGSASPGERAAIHAAMAEIAARTGDTIRQEREVAAALRLFDATTSQHDPRHALLWQAMGHMATEAGRRDVARDAIERYDILQRAGPGGAMRAARELEIAQLLHRNGAVEAAVGHFEAALRHQLDAQDLTPAERLDAIRHQYLLSYETEHAAAQVRAGTFLLTNPVKDRFKNLGEYASLLDVYAMMAGRAGEIAAMTAVALLRGPQGDVAVGTESGAQAALALVASSAPQATLKELARKAGIPHALGERYFLDIHVLNAALEKIKAALPVDAQEVQAAVTELVVLHSYAGRDDLARVQLLRYRDEVLSAAGAGSIGTSGVAGSLGGIEALYRRLGDPSAADETRQLGALQLRRQRQHACMGMGGSAAGTMRVWECRLYAKELHEKQRTGEGVGVLLRLYDQLARHRASKQAVDLSNVADELDVLLTDVLPREERGRLFFFKGSLRFARIGRICAALIDTPLFGRHDGYCMGRQLHAPAPRDAVSIAGERARLYRAAFEHDVGQIARILAEANDSRAQAVALHAIGKDPTQVLEVRRFALLVAWETRLRTVPRNEATEASLLLDLASLYDDDDPLVLEWLRLAVDTNASGSSTTAGFLRQALLLASAAEPQAVAVVRLNQSIAVAHENLLREGREFDADDIEVQLDLAAALPTTALARYERLIDASVAAPAAGVVSRLCGALLRASADPTLAGRAHLVMQRLLSKQRHQAGVAASARAEALMAAIELSQRAGASGELPALIDELGRVAPAEPLLAAGADRLVPAWRAAAVATRGLAAQRNRASMLPLDSPTDTVVAAYRDALATALEARNFAAATALVDELLRRALRQRGLVKAGIHASNLVEEVRMGANVPCYLDGKRPAGHALPLRNWRDACAALMATWHRDIALYAVVDAAMAPQAERLDEVGLTALEEHLRWQVALIDSAGDPDGRRGLVSLELVALVRDARRETADSLLGRVDAILAGGVTGAAQLPATLASDEAILVLHAAEESLYSWLITRRGVAFLPRQVDRAELRQAIRRARQIFYLAPAATELPAVDVEALADLYQLLLGPLTKRLSDIRQLNVAPNGVIAAVPYSVLVASPPRERSWRPADRWQPDWLLRGMGVTVLRSVGVARAPEHVAGERNIARFLGLGDPLPLAAEEAVRLGMPCLALQPPLDGAAAELREAAAIFGNAQSALHQREHFTLPALGELAWDQYRYILIASHAVQPDTGGCVSQSAIVTSAAGHSQAPLLTTSALAKLRLRADVVVLSACESGVDDLHREQRPLGALASAFLDAGARNVIGAAWPLVSKHAGALTTALFGIMHAGEKDPARGLRRAMLALADAPQPELAHPLIWGALFVAKGP